MKTISDIAHGTAMTFDSDDGVVLYDSSRIDGSGDIAALAPSKFAGHFTQRITALYFDASQHALLVACGSTIYKVAANSTPVQIAGGFQSIYAMAADAADNLYVIDGDHVSAVQNGAPRVLTGAFIGAPYTDPEVTAQVPQLTFDSSDGALYATDPVNDVVDRITTAGQVSTLAGKCYPAGANSCYLSNIAGTGSGAVFGTPSGIVYDAANNTLYMSDAWNNNIWTITPQGAATQVAGYGAFGLLDGNGVEAFLTFPFLLALDDRTGLLYMRTWVDATQYLESYATKGSPAPTQTTPVQRFMLSPVRYGAGEIAVAPDGSAWTSEELARKVARIDSFGNIREYTLPAPWYQPWRLIVDPAGNVWTGAQNSQQGATTGAALVRFDANGNATAFPLSASPSGGDIVNALSLDNNGNVWFTKSNAYGGSVGYVDPLGQLHEFSVGSTFNAPRPQALAQGPDGLMWFSYTSNAIGRVSTSGQFSTPLTVSTQANITRMLSNPASGNVWFTDEQFTVGTIDATGTVKTIPGFEVATSYGVADAYPTQLALDASGNLWASEANFQDVARVDASGKITRFALPQNNPGVAGVGVRPDGQVWVGSGMAVFLLNSTSYDAARLPHAVRRKKSP